jgi:hypothetical protein
MFSATRHEGCSWTRVRLGIALFLGVCGFAGRAQADPVKPAPAVTPGRVATEQHPIRVGDVIMAPAVQTDEEETEGIRRPGHERSAETTPPKRWYGLPILITDGVAYVLLATAVTNEKSRPITATLSLPAYALGGPITHAANAHWGRAGISLLMRAGLPFTGILIGASDCGGSGNCASDAISGAIAGMVIASIVDVAALSWKTVEPPRATSIEPSLALGRDAAWVGASGRF